MGKIAIRKIGTQFADNNDNNINNNPKSYSTMRKLIITLMLMLPLMLCAQSQALKIYGGADHKTYLGKFDAATNDAESIWNEKGQFGNKANALSIWNQKGQYGNPESKFSPWAELNDATPILVDANGNEVGKLNAVNGNEQVQFVCMFYSTIVESKEYNLQYWFNTIFADTYQEEYDMKYFAPKEMLE